MTVPGPPVTEDEISSISPVDVRIVENATAVREDAADFGAWQTFHLVAGNPTVQVLRRNIKRSRAVIRVSTDTVAAPLTDGVILGSEAQMNSAATVTRTTGIGGYLPIGTIVTIESQSEHWAGIDSANTNGIYITVLEEVWDAAG